MILKGQNFRIYEYDSQGQYKVIAQATSCTATLTGNTEDASHKDIVGNATMNSVVSKSWQVQVESLNVLNMASLLTQIKSRSKFQIEFDEASTTDNQTEQKAAFARRGDAYISDITFAFNNRENSTKSITFMGTDALSKVPSQTPGTAVIPVSTSLTKGQFVRLFLGNDASATPSKVIGSAVQLQFHISVAMESATTKDTEGDWIINEPMDLSYDITSNALVRGGDNITSGVEAQDLASIEDIFEASTPVKFEIANVSGANQRTKGSVLVSGLVTITQLTINAANRQNATYDTTLTNYGDYTVGA